MKRIRGLHARHRLSSVAIMLLLCAVVPAKAQLLPTCPPVADFPQTLTPPATADREAVMDVIHKLYWALDGVAISNFDPITMDNVKLEVCNSGDQQIHLSNTREDLKNRMDEIAGERREGSFDNRHFESNTLLHLDASGEIMTQSAMLVTAQFDAFEVPQLDYTGTLRATLVRDGTVWKFSSLRLKIDSAKVSLRAR